MDGGVPKNDREAETRLRNAESGMEESQSGLGQAGDVNEHTVFTLRSRSKRKDLLADEIRLIGLLSDTIEERVPADASEADRRAMAERLATRRPGLCQNCGAPSGDQ
jgi:hypothetical protein